MVRFNKTGVVDTSCETANENLILDSKSKVVSHLESGNEYIAINLGQSYMDVPDGTTVTISFDLELNYAKASTYFQVYNTNNKGPKTFTSVNIGHQVYDGETVGSTIKKRVSLEATITDRVSHSTTNNYIEFYSQYHTGNLFKISNLKMELGTKATPWCENSADESYFSPEYGFNEENHTAKIFQNHIQANEIIEY